MSDTEKQAWLASLLGGQVPPVPVASAAPSTPPLFRNTSDNSLSANGLSVSTNGDSAPGIQRSSTTGDFRSSARASPTRLATLPPPTLTEGGAQSQSLVIAWSWQPQGTEGKVSEYAFALEWHGDGEDRTTLKIDAPPTKALIRNLVANTTYYVRVVAERTTEGSFGSKSHLFSAESRLPTVPEAPPLPEVFALSPTSVGLRWRPPQEGAARYSVYGSAVLNFAKLYAGSKCECVLSELSPGTSYGFRVCALNSLGGASEFSAELPVTTPALSGTGAAPAAGTTTAAAAAAAAPSPPSLSISLPALQLLSLDATSATLHWPAATVSGAVQASTQLYVESRPLAGSQDVVASLRFAGAVSASGTLRIAGLSPHSQWQLRLLAIDGGAGGTRLSEGLPLRLLTDPGVPGQAVLLPQRVKPDCLAMRWDEPPGGCVRYSLEMAEPEAEEEDDRGWDTIYDGATAGCEISYLSAGTRYLFRLAAMGEGTRRGDFTPVLEVTTPLREGEPALVGGGGARGALSPRRAPEGEQPQRATLPSSAPSPLRQQQPQPQLEEQQPEGLDSPMRRGRRSSAHGQELRAGDASASASPAAAVPPAASSGRAEPEPLGGAAREPRAEEAPAATVAAAAAERAAAAAGRAGAAAPSDSASRHPGPGPEGASHARPGPQPSRIRRTSLVEAHAEPPPQAAAAGRAGSGRPNATFGGSRPADTASAALCGGEGCSSSQRQQQRQQEGRARRASAERQSEPQQQPHARGSTAGRQSSAAMLQQPPPRPADAARLRSASASRLPSASASASRPRPGSAAAAPPPSSAQPGRAGPAPARAETARQPAASPQRPRPQRSSESDSAAMHAAALPRHRRPPLPQPSGTQPSASASASASVSVHAKLHEMHALRMARIDRLHAERQESILSLAASPRHRERSGLADGALSPREQHERLRPSAAFASLSPRSPAGRARSPVVAERSKSPGPGEYPLASSFISGARLKRAIIGASSAFRSASPRLQPPSPRGSGQAESPGPGAYEASSVNTLAALAKARKKAAGKREPFSSNSPRMGSPGRRDSSETPGPGHYDDYDPQRERARHRRTVAAFGTLSPRFDPRGSTHGNDTPSPVYYSPRR